VFNDKRPSLLAGNGKALGIGGKLAGLSNKGVI
jgi:hypothetical protein